MLEVNETKTEIETKIESENKEEKESKKEEEEVKEEKKSFLYNSLSFDPSKETLNTKIVFDCNKYSQAVCNHIENAVYRIFADTNISGDAWFANSTEIADTPSLSFCADVAAAFNRLNTNRFIFREIDYITASQNYKKFKESALAGYVHRFIEKFFTDRKAPERPVEAEDNPDWDPRFIAVSLPVSELDYDKRFFLRIAYDKYGTVDKTEESFRVLTPYETSLLSVFLCNEFPGRFVLEWRMLVSEKLLDGKRDHLIGELYLAPMFVSLEKRKSLYPLDLY